MSRDLSGWSESQRQAILARGENVLVSAGAGSGKTSVLVERVIQCLFADPPVDIDRLLVVTFTEAAAAEMRQRIGDRLQAMIASDDHQDVMDLKRQVRLLEQSHISTLHSFCMQVVRRNFLYLDVEPNFDLLSEDDALVLRSQLLDQVLEAKLSSGARQGMAQMLMRFGAKNPSRITPLVFRLDEFSRSQPDPEKWLSVMSQRFLQARDLPFSDLPWTGAFLQWVKRSISEATVLFTEARAISGAVDELAKYADNLDALLASTAEAEQAAAALIHGEPLETVAALLTAVLAQKSPRAGEHPAKEDVQQRRKAGLDRLSRVVEIIARGETALVADILELAPDVAALVTLVLAFQEAYAKAKRERNVLDFSDLEHMALRALQDEGCGEARRLQDHFVEIFVDEYQDTSPIQDALVNAVSRPGGNVFVVGDVKQSIYRFRMADPSLFLDKYQSLGTQVPGRVIDLSENYRSRGSVVNTVNFLFEQLFSRQFGGIDYDARSRMNAGASYPDNQALQSLAGPTEVHLIERVGLIHQGHTNESETIDRIDGMDVDSMSGEAVPGEELSAIEKEAHVIGERILHLMGRVEGSGAHSVWDAKQQTARPLRYKDIVILLRSVKMRMNTILEVLRGMGIPAYGATSTGFSGALEVQWLQSALAAIDNPRREIDFTALLRSPLAGFADAELALIRMAEGGNFYDAFRAVSRGAVPSRWDQVPEFGSGGGPAVTLVEKTRRFYRQLNRWRTESRRAPVEQVLKRIIDETNYLYYVSAMQGGGVRRANVLSLLDRARVFDRTSVDGVFGFVAHAKAAQAHEVDTGEARTLGENEDVVRIMTIHQSKGLEFPVVFVADLGKMFYRDPQERIFPLHRDLGFGPQLLDDESNQRWRTLPSIAIEEAELSEFLAEEARVLYVALTRARERLVLVGSARDLPQLLDSALQASQSEGRALPMTTMIGAKSPLDWLLPAFLGAQDAHSLYGHGSGGGKPQPIGGSARFEFVLWNVQGGRDLPLQYTALATERRLAVSEAGEIRSLLSTACRGDASVGTTNPAAFGTYGETPLVIETTPDERRLLPGKVSATELRRLWVAKKSGTGGNRQTTMHRSSAESLLEDPVLIREEVMTGRESGIAFHKVMQVINFQIEPTESAVMEELVRLQGLGKVTKAQQSAVAVDEILMFLQSNLGGMMRLAQRVLREQPFFHRIDLAEDINSPAIITQGVIDCLLEHEDRWVLIDYKTDRVVAGDVEAKAEEYTAQISTYQRAIEAAVPGKQVDAFLYFVKPGTAIQLPSVDVQSLFRTP